MRNNKRENLVEGKNMVIAMRKQSIIFFLVFCLLMAASPTTAASPVMVVTSPLFEATISGPHGSCSYVDNLFGLDVAAASIAYQEDLVDGHSTTTFFVKQASERSDDCPTTVNFDVTVTVPAWSERVEEVELSEDGCTTTSKLVDLNSNQDLQYPIYRVAETIEDQCTGSTWSYEAIVFGFLVGP